MFCIYRRWKTVQVQILCVYLTTRFVLRIKITDYFHRKITVFPFVSSHKDASFRRYSTTGGGRGQERGGQSMDNNNLSTVQSIQTALDILPAEKREYIVGYAEGVIAMAERFRTEQERASA